MYRDSEVSYAGITQARVGCFWEMMRLRCFPSLEIYLMTAILITNSNIIELHRARVWAQKLKWVTPSEITHTPFLFHVCALPNPAGLSGNLLVIPLEASGCARAI